VGREGTTMTHLIETQFTCQQPAQPVISTPMYLPDDPVHFHSQPDIENNTPNPSLGETFREAVERGLAPYRNQSIPDTEGKEGVSAPVDFDHSGRGDATRR